MTATGLHVGIDLDGVMFDYTRNIAEFIAAEFRDEGDPDFADLVEETVADDWHWYRKWGWSDDEFLAANARAAAAGHLYRGGIVDDWVEVLHALREQGHSIHIVTARFEGSPGPTAEWLRQHQVPHDALTFAYDKSRLGLDVLIDDRHENMEAWVATGKYGILYDQPWNQHSNTGAIRVFNPHHARAAIGTIAAWMHDDLVSEQRPSESALEEAQRLVHGDRGRDYGHPIDDFTRTGRIWAAILGLPEVTPQEVGLCMAGVKISRQVNRPKRDNMVDLAGYAETVQMVMDELT